MSDQPYPFACLQLAEAIRARADRTSPTSPRTTRTSLATVRTSSSRQPTSSRGSGRRASTVTSRRCASCSARCTTAATMPARRRATSRRLSRPATAPASRLRATALTVVIHGTADRLVGPSGGRAAARAIPGARLVTIEGKGTTSRSARGRRSSTRSSGTRGALPARRRPRATARPRSRRRLRRSRSRHGVTRQYLPAAEIRVGAVAVGRRP